MRRIACGYFMAICTALASTIGGSPPAIASAPAAAPHPARITWHGYRGIHLREHLEIAAALAGAALSDHCGFYHQFTFGPVDLSDISAHNSGRVESFIPLRRSVTGPGGIRLGMTTEAAVAALGPKVKTGYLDGPSYHQAFHYVHRPGLGFLYVGNPVDGPEPRRIHRWGISSSLAVAAANIANEGGC